MEFRILGTVEVRRDGEALPLGGAKRRALLALLLLHANEVVSADRLVDDLWGERPPQNAAAALHNNVSRLRKLLGADLLASRPGGYCLCVDPSVVDLHRFESLVAEAGRAPTEARAALLHEALSLWRGPALADLAYEPVAVEAGRLEEARLAALESRIDADLELARHAELVGELEALVAEHPLRERMRGQLILALYRSGRQAEALDVYRETRRVLADELGLDPSPELRELELAILRQDPTLAAPPRPHAPSTIGRPRRRRAVALAFAVLLLLVAASAAGVLGLRASESTPVAVREPARVATPSPAAEQVATTSAAARRPKPKAQAPERVRVGQKAKPSRRPAIPPAVVPRPRTVPGTRTPSPKATPSPAPAPAPKPSAPKPTQPLRLDDDFAAGLPDPLIWHYVGRDNGATFDASGGRLVVGVSPDAKPDAQWNQVGGHVGTRCRFDGDFDARVDFELLEWPAGSNVYAGLNAIYADSAVVRQASSRWGDNYASWVIPANVGVELPERAGRLRIRREGATVSTYFWYDGRWTRLAVGTSRGAAVLALQAQANGDEFARVPVRVAFDNFVVEAPDADCPAGADPRDA